MALSEPDQPPIEITGSPDSRMIEEAVWSVATATSQVAPSWCFFRYVIIAEETWVSPMPPVVRPDADWPVDWPLEVEPLEVLVPLGALPLVPVPVPPPGPPLPLGRWPPPMPP